MIFFSDAKFVNFHSRFLGNQYTLADAIFTCTLARLNFIGLLDDELKNRPKLTNWWTKVQARPSFKNAGIVSSPFSIGTFIKKLFG